MTAFLRENQVGSTIHADSVGLLVGKDPSPSQGHCLQAWSPIRDVLLMRPCGIVAGSVRLWNTELELHSHPQWSRGGELYPCTSFPPIYSGWPGLPGGSPPFHLQPLKPKPRPHTASSQAPGLHGSSAKLVVSLWSPEWCQVMNPQGLSQEGPAPKQISQASKQAPHTSRPA